MGSHGESFRVVSVQRDGQRLRAMEHRSGDWRCHPWVEGIDVATLRVPAMPAAAAGLIFWSCEQYSFLLLDTTTMAFSTISLPLPLANLSTEQLRPRPWYAIGDTEAGECCLVSVIGRTTLQVWLLKKNGTGNSTWELEKQRQISDLVEFNNRRFRSPHGVGRTSYSLLYG